MTDNLRSRLDHRIASYKEVLAAAPTQRSLFTRYPIRGRIPYVHLADAVPTPVSSIDTDRGTLWVKRDDVTSTLYGGNKVRKLEFVLAAALQRNCTPIVVGATRSHQVLASAIFTRLLGMDCEAVLFPQPPSTETDVVSAVLDSFDIPVHLASNPYQSPLTIARALMAKDKARGRRCLIYPGSSSPAGILGYVDCGLEIVNAIHAGELPKPDVVYTALGTGGTTVGLAIGLALGGVDSRVCAVRVAEPAVSNQWHLRNLEWRTRRLLASLGVAAPRAFDRINLITSFLGDGYGHPLPEARFAVELAMQTGLPVDQTYTAKALAAAIDHQRRYPTDSVLFLETLSAVELATDVANLS